MALPLPALRTDTVRFSFIQGGRTRVCHPAVAAGAAPTLSLEPGDNEGAFYYRYKLGKALIFSGSDYRFLLGIEQSNDRCQPIGLLLETRSSVNEPFQHETQLTFTCNEGKNWDYDACTVTVTPATDDAYRLFLENWDQEYNILAFDPLSRVSVTAQLATLTSGITLEWVRTDTESQADLLGVNGWASFLTNTSWISGSLTQLGTYEKTVLLFRYRLIGVPLAAPAPPSTQYTPVDKSDTGWQVLSVDNTAHTADYVKSPTISGFKAYKIGTKNDWNDPLNPASSNRYGDQLLLLPCYETPADYGLNVANYLKVTGSGGSGGGPSIGGAYNQETIPCLNVRDVVDEDQAYSLWWKFGSFRFGRGMRLLDAVYFLLGQTVAATGQTSILPPSPQDLSVFYTAPTNPATGDSGVTNEIPRLLLSAASDVKRYGASEAATRVMVSMKTLLSDLTAFHDTGWFIDPATGWFRLEHRAYRETARLSGLEWDLTQEPEAVLPRSYSYRTGQLPRYEELTISSATTEDLALGVYFGKASIDYGMGGCVNNREGQNKTTRTASRLSGDVTAAVLSGDSIPDNALIILAPDTQGRLTDANRQLAASELLRRYHTYSAATYSATVAGQALVVRSVRPGREQVSQSVYRCTLRGLDGTTRLTTGLGSNGEIGKADLDLQTGVVTLTPWMPTPDYTSDAPTLHRDFAPPFNEKFS